MNGKKIFSDISWQLAKLNRFSTATKWPKNPPDCGGKSKADHFSLHDDDDDHGDNILICT